MGCSVQPGSIRIHFLGEMIPEYLRMYVRRLERLVSLTNTASSYPEDSGLKDYWWGGEVGEMKKDRDIHR